MTGLLALAVLLLATTAAGTATIIRIQARQRAYQERVAGIAGLARPARAAAPTLMRRDTQQKPTLTERLAGIIALDLARRDQYRFPWYIVVSLSLLAGWGEVQLASGMVGPWAWLDVPLVVVFCCRAYHTGADRKRREKLLAQFPDALSLIVRAVRVGIPVTESLRAVAKEMPQPTCGEFERLRQEIAVGTTLEVALRGLARRNLLPEYGFFAAVLALQAQTGGALTETLEMLADIIRRRIAMRDRGHALSSEARMSTYVLGALPFVAGLLLWFASPDYMGLLFSEQMGHAFLGAAFLSLLVGMGIMRTIIRRTLS